MDVDVAKRKKGQKADPNTGDVFVEAVYNPDTSKKEGDSDEDSKEGEGEEDGGEDDEDDEDGEEEIRDEVRVEYNARCRILL